jgi:uncharacterized protein YhdP
MQETPRDSATPTDLRAPRAAESSAPARRASRSVVVPLRVWTFGVRGLFWLTLLLIALFAASIAVTRFWLIPNADDFRPRVVEALSKLTKQRVAIGGFSAGWNGWSPELRVSRLQILDQRGRTLLELPEVETTLSWRSLLALEPRLSLLTVRQPRVVVRRTTENQLTVAGIDVDLNDATPGDPGALEWLLRQRFVQIENGEIEWHDEWRGLAPLRMREVNVRLANDGAHHRIGMRATPSAEIASPIEFRSVIVGSNLRKVSDWDGSAYLRVDYANVAALSKYLPLPMDIARGDGGIQAWFDFEDGRPVSVTTDLVVRDARVVVRPVNPAPVRTNALQSAATNSLSPPIAFNDLAGRISWSETALPKDENATASYAQRWSLRDVSVTTLNREKLPALSGELKLDRTDSALLGGEFRAAKIDLATAHSLSSVVAPLLPTAVVEQARAAAPRGTLSEVVASWKTGTAARISYDVVATASDVKWSRGALPGVSGLSGKLRANDQSGEFAFGSLSIGDEKKNSTARQAIEKVGSVFSKKVADQKIGAAGAKVVNKVPLVLDLGDMFSDPLSIGAIGGRVNWKVLAPTPAAVVAPSEPMSMAASGATKTPPLQLLVTTDGIEVEGEHVKARFAGSWRSDELGPGVAAINGKLESVDAQVVHRYLPRGVGEGAKRWVKNAITGGRVADATFAVEGSLWHFPFQDAKHGKFEIVAPVRDVVVDYADDWPAAKQVDALLTFRGTSFEAAVNRATIAGAAITATQIKIADMSNPEASVEIRGTASSTTDNFLRFVETSPINRMIDRFTEGAKGTGTSKLTLGLNIPIRYPERTKIDGDIAFENNRIELAGDVPPLEGVSGRLIFSEKEMSAKELRANAFGGSTTIAISTDAGVIKANANGRAELARVRETFDYPLLDQLTGSMDWRMDLQTGAAASVRINGVLSPQALPIDAVYQSGSTARDTTLPIPFSLVRSSLAQGRDRVEFEIPAHLHAIIERSAERARDTRVVERAVIDFGAQKTALPTRGYSLRGEVAKLDTDAALALVPALTGKNSKNVGGVKSESSTPDFVNVNLKIDRAVIFSHVLSDVSLRAQPSGQRWRLALRSKEATGVVSVDNESESGNVEAVSVRLQRFSFPPAATAADRMTNAPRALSTNQNAASSDANARWPKLDLIADAFVSEGRELGRLEVKAQPGSNEWRIEAVKLTNADGAINATGQWKQPLRSVAAANGQTSVDVALNWKDAGRFMQRFGFPKGIERGEGELTGKLSWEGSPAQFAYPKLNGEFSLKTKAGRFTEMEPGIAKLLGVISLQSLPRRLSFNFDDLFGRGFAFDSVASEVKIANGKATTDSFAIIGPAARVEIRGDADLIAETSTLRVRVFPSLSVAAAIGIGLATANPAIGAAAWLGQKIAKDPVERLLMQEFDISGPWATPEVKQTRGVGTNNREDSQSLDSPTQPSALGRSPESVQQQ